LKAIRSNWKVQRNLGLRLGEPVPAGATDQLLSEMRREREANLSGQWPESQN
jgi:hypothetical protein